MHSFPVLQAIAKKVLRRVAGYVCGLVNPNLHAVTRQKMGD